MAGWRCRNSRVALLDLAIPPLLVANQRVVPEVVHRTVEVLSLLQEDSKLGLNDHHKPHNGGISRCCCPPLPITPRGL